jgi:ABC-type microcin C transport system permease subunit YejE
MPNKKQTGLTTHAKLIAVSFGGFIGIFGAWVALSS